MKRKRATGKRKPKKPPVVGDDEPFNTTNQSGLNDFNSGQVDSRMEATTQQNNTKGGPRAGSEERGAVNDRVEDYANSLPDTIASSPCKAARGISTRSSRRMGSSITNLAACAILLQQGRTLQKEANTPHQDPRYKEQELKAALAVIKKVMQMNAAEPFNVPVDPITLGIPDYFDVIDTPMDFGTICSNLENGIKYLNSKDVLEDVQYIWENCSKYNTKGQYILGLMKQVKKNFTKYWTAAGLYSEPPGGINGPLHLPTMESTMRGSKRGSNSQVGPMNDNTGHLQQDQMGLSPLEMHQPSLSYNQIRPPQQKPCQCQSSCVQPQPSQLEADIDISNAGNPHLPAPMECPVRRRTRGRRSPVGTMTDSPIPQQNGMGPSKPQLRQASASYKQSYQPQQRSFQCHPGSTQSQPSQPQAGSNISCAGNSNSSLSQPSSSVPPAFESSESKAPKEKMKVTIEEDGSVVGEYSKVWSTRTGDFVRAHIPISYADIRKVPKNFKDDVWNALMGEFELDVPPAVARPLAEKSWSQKFRTYKNTLRALLKNGDPIEVKPKCVDPRIWRQFVENESDPKKQQQNVTNLNNRKKLEFSHCLGRRSYAQKRYLMQQENPGKQVRRVDKWLAAHERSDGTVLESAKSKYDEVKAAENRRKSKSLTGEGCSNTCEDLDSDELVEVFGKERKGGVRAVGSYISKKQLIHIGVARSKIEENKKANEEAASLKDKIISQVESRLDNFEGLILSLVSKLSNMTTPPLVTTPLTGVGSHSVNRNTHLTRNLNNVFSTMGVPHYPHSRPTPVENPPVILLDKFGKELAKGYVVMDATANVCHSKHIGLGEKKVYIEEVMEPDARLWDPPQGGHDTLAAFVHGGFVIWLECWLKHV